MTIEHFQELLKNNNAIPVYNRYLIFNDYDIYDLKTDDMKKNKTLEELLENTIEDKKVKTIIEETEEFYALEEV